MVNISNPDNRIELLHSLVLKLLNAASLQEMLEGITLAIIDELKSFDCAIFLYEPSHRQLICHSYIQANARDSHSLKLKAVPVGIGVIGTAAKEKKTQLIENTDNCDYYLVDLKKNFSELTVPILDQDTLVGVIDLEHPEAAFFTLDDAIFVETVASMISAAIKSQQANEKLKLTVEKLQFTEKKLKENETNYRNLIEQAGDGIFIHDPHGHFVDVNQQAILSLGYSRDELLRMRVQDIDTMAAQVPSCISDFYSKLRPNEPLVVEGQHQRKDGTVFPVEVKLGLLDNGNVVAVARDISMRKAIKTELDSTKSFMQEVVNTSPDVIYVFDFNKNQIVNGGDRFSHFLGYDSDKFSSWQSVLEMTHPDDIPEMERRAEEILHSKQGEIIKSEARFKKSNGSWVWIRNHCKVSLRDEQGRPMLEVGTLSDISYKKNIENELVNNQSYYKALVENGYDGIVVHDQQGRVTYISGGTLSLMGFTEGEMLKKVGKDFSHPEDKNIPIHAWKQSLNAPRQTITVPDYRLLRKDGSYIWVEHTFTNLLNDLAVNGVVSNFRDITDKKIAQQQVIKREKYFRSLVENAFDGIVLYDSKAKVKFYSRSVEKMLGYEPHDAVTKSGLDFVFEEDKPLAYDAWQWIMKHPGEPYRIPDYRLLKKDGGLVWVENTLTNLIDDPNVRGVISNFRDISHKKLAEQSIYRISNYDSLTELPNRNFLKQQLERQILQARKEKSSLTLVYFDIVQLNSINNAMGHQIGDQVLRYVAERISDATDEFDLLARSGNDEFALVLNYRDAFEASKIVESILVNFEKLIKISDVELKVNLRAGIARYPDDANSSQDLLSKAEIAVSRVKDISASYTFFKQQDGDLIRYKVNLEKDLIRAIDKDELELYYQPKVCLKTGTIHSVEALLRWCHPEKGFVSPQIMINIAEESSLIYKLTQWVLEAAAKQIKKWKQEGINTKIAINLSARDLLLEQFDVVVKNCLTQYQVDAKSLEIEITESAAMVDMQKSILTLRKLSEMGISISLDDFGTGYSSISHLTSLPVDLVKIDQSFIRSLKEKSHHSLHDNKLIIKNIIRLAESFKLISLIEGIETKEQCLLLQSYGCDLGQGYYFSKPKPAAEIEPLITLGFIDLEDPVSTTITLNPDSQHPRT